MTRRRAAMAPAHWRCLLASPRLASQLKLVNNSERENSTAAPGELAGRGVGPADRGSTARSVFTARCDSRGATRVPPEPTLTYRRRTESESESVAQLPAGGGHLVGHRP